MPIYFVGATPFNLLGLDRWVRNFTYITYYDGVGRRAPRVFTPRHKPYIEFSSGEEINNWLLEERRGARVHAPGALGPRPKIAMVFFDEETERICDELGYDLILPSAAAAQASRLQAGHHPAGQRGRGAERAERADPGRATGPSWPRRPSRAGLGADLVIQTPYGDSGKTTFFISSEADWEQAPGEIAGHEVKVMKRINNRPVAVEAVLTRRGTIVGPFMSELTGQRQADPVPRRLVRQRDVPRGAHR